MKIALIVVSLVDEAQKISNNQLEAEISSNIELTSIPWSKRLIKVAVFETPRQLASAGSH